MRPPAEQRPSSGLGLSYAVFLGCFAAAPWLQAAGGDFLKQGYVDWEALTTAATAFAAVATLRRRRGCLSAVSLTVVGNLLSRLVRVAPRMPLCAPAPPGGQGPPPGGRSSGHRRRSIPK
eukprot:TRINITY_DN13801_c0_g1_i2.p3 TRINITY_DN13801_c0_g1~~TRINITY_DN13801_c0_g1_i2.p3  ORF type:complete len:120 (+),score=23.59 TRINITY_DN13801_c0_g1_i2:72-431(+)